MLHRYFWTVTSRWQWTKLAKSWYFYLILFHCWSVCGQKDKSGLLNNPVLSEECSPLSILWLWLSKNKLVRFEWLRTYNSIYNSALRIFQWVELYFYSSLPLILTEIKFSASRRWTTCWNESNPYRIPTILLENHVGHHQ